MQKLRCVVERITYQNPENGYSVMRVKVKGLLSFICLLIFCNIEFVLTMLGLCCKMEVARTSGLQSSISY